MGARQGTLGEVSPYPYAPAIPARGTPGRVSVVVVHYEGESDLSLCCDSVFAQGHPDLELIVVDNGSRDGAPARLRSDPRLKRLWLPDNQGFAAGANAGLLAATGEALLLLNPDAALRRGCLAALLEALEDVDIAAPRLLLASHPDRLDNCGHDLFPDGLNWCRGRGERADGRYEDPEDLLVFSGAAVAFRRSALALCGGLDPTYWAYGEDADLALRAARFDLRCRYVPSAVATHRVGGSFGSHGLLKAFLVERNRVRVAATHLPLTWLMAAPLWTGARVAALGLAALVGKGAGGGYSRRDRALLPLMLSSAWIAGVVDLPGSLGRRVALGRLGERRGLDSRLGEARVGIRALLRRPAL